MSTIDSSASRREMVNWLRGHSKNEIVAVALLVNRLDSENPIPLYHNKEEILRDLLKVDRGIIWAAIDQVFPDEDACGDAEEDENDDGDEEDSDEFEDE